MYLGRWCNAKLMLMGDYSEEKSKTKNTTFIGDDAAVAYLSMEYIDAVLHSEEEPMVHVRRVAAQLWLRDKDAVLGCVTKAVAEDAGDAAGSNGSKRQMSHTDARSSKAQCSPSQPPQPAPASPSQRSHVMGASPHAATPAQGNPSLEAKWAVMDGM